MLRLFKRISDRLTEPQRKGAGTETRSGDEFVPRCLVAILERVALFPSLLAPVNAAGFECFGEELQDQAIERAELAARDLIQSGLHVFRHPDVDGHFHASAW